MIDVPVISTIKRWEAGRETTHMVEGDYSLSIQSAVKFQICQHVLKTFNNVPFDEQLWFSQH